MVEAEILGLSSFLTLRGPAPPTEDLDVDEDLLLALLKCGMEDRPSEDDLRIIA